MNSMYHLHSEIERLKAKFGVVNGYSLSEHISRYN